MVAFVLVLVLVVVLVVVLVLVVVVNSQQSVDWHTSSAHATIGNGLITYMPASQSACAKPLAAHEAACVVVEVEVLVVVEVEVLVVDVLVVDVLVVEVIVAVMVGAAVVAVQSAEILNLATPFDLPCTPT